ncbi:MAG TPA: phosphate ABC transporter ATP-binding protein [Candidatus Limnocylindria bacterium]|jgi:phosphate transport system ATP-binding protein|nr:phosphate ABC transporter ATP-binding protein [Candidatus Limnocylindria bacterium]
MSLPLESATATLRTKNLRAWYGKRLAISEIDIAVRGREITAIIGPSGCGKSTLLRCLNRIHETVSGAYAQGEVLLDGENVYKREIDVIALRRRVGMVFQRPSPFPTMSIAENVLAGPRYAGLRLGRLHEKEVLERALRDAALWNEVKDGLRRPAVTLSGGQQQRLCIARALAMRPAVLLMDEPTGSLDPLSTLQIEDLVTALAHRYAVVVVTHNLQQAARIADQTIFMLADEFGAGHVIEAGSADHIFTRPTDRRTEDYVSGRFG